MLFGDCPRPLTEAEEEHGKVKFIKDINIEWRPSLKNYQQSQRDAGEFQNVEGYMLKK